MAYAIFFLACSVIVFLIYKWEYIRYRMRTTKRDRDLHNDAEKLVDEVKKKIESGDITDVKDIFKNINNN